MILCLVRNVIGERVKKLMNSRSRRELYVMMFTMQRLHYRGITIRETVMESLGNLFAVVSSIR